MNHCLYTPAFFCLLFFFASASDILRKCMLTPDRTWGQEQGSTFLHDSVILNPFYSPLIWFSPFFKTEVRLYPLSSATTDEAEEEAAGNWDDFKLEQKIHRGHRSSF